MFNKNITPWAAYIMRRRLMNQFAIFYLGEQVLVKTCKSFVTPDFHLYIYKENPVLVQLKEQFSKQHKQEKQNIASIKSPVCQKLVYKSPDSALNALLTQRRCLKFVFIDEVFMAGSNMLHLIHKRFKEIMGSAKDFGGLAVIFAEDLFQLKPVRDSFI